jgi:hypothetical protein
MRSAYDEKKAINSAITLKTPGTERLPRSSFSPELNVPPENTQHGKHDRHGGKRSKRRMPKKRHPPAPAGDGQPELNNDRDNPAVSPRDRALSFASWPRRRCPIDPVFSVAMPATRLWSPERSGNLVRRMFRSR